MDDFTAMTQDQFNRLPGLLTLAQFITVSGMTRHKVREAVDAGVIGSHRGPPDRGRKKSYRKYYKHDAARIGGFHL